MWCLASLVVAASGCARQENDPEEQLAAETSGLTQEAPPRVPVEHASPLRPGAKLDRAQLVAVVGEAAAAGVGDSCSTVGLMCASPINAIVRECGGFTSTCDSSGTEDVLPVSFFCLPGTGGNVCTAIAGQNQQTIACTVPTDGKSCSTGCGADFCAAYSSDCDQDTDRVRNCFSGGVCSNDSCVNQTVSQQVVGTCTRLTEGHRCTTRTLCPPPTVGLCTVSGACACLTGPQ
jgi:hypothetical protein